MGRLNAYRQSTEIPKFVSNSGTHHCHIVETGNESIRFSRSTAEAKKRIKAREQTRKGPKTVSGWPSHLDRRCEAANDRVHQ